MRRYTTPFEELYVPGVDLTSATVYVTFADRKGDAILTIYDADVVEYMDGSKITAHMTQEQSARFIAGQEYLVQVNWLSGPERQATCIAHIRCHDNLLREVLP